MNKKLIIIIGFITISAISLWLYSGAAKFVNYFSEKPLVSLEQVYESDSLKKVYGLASNKSPIDYGFKNVVELQFSSVSDNLQLSGWFIKPDSAMPNKCLIFAHSAGKNRLEMLKYLKIITEFELQDEFCIFIPDLRNAGNSKAAPTFMGYHMSDDITSSMMLINQKFQINDFVLYGVAEGAMASALAVRKRESLFRLNHANITVDKVILDSPISAARETLKRKGNDFSIINRNLGLWLYNKKVDDYLEKMDISILLSNLNKGYLIMQNIGDEETPTDILLSKLLDQPNIELQLFDGDEHAGMIIDPDYSERYIRLAGLFLSEE
ncbi:hypothetical protein R9C00_26135 [Flammeovirgaceae bacterium SG7u.111]|nr:hypothetical protein [Flammeovirgaceae bacterium SG7u.132]WPO35178.1 hypothetical protein R9C00_26135 [Flammeovirgaceae bacterium SG7u.111]